MGYPIPPCINKKKSFGGILIWSFGRAERWPNVNAVCCVSEQNGYCSRSAHGQLKLIADAHLDNKFPNIIIAAVLVWNKALAERYIHQRVRIYFAMCSKTIREYELLPITPDCIGARPPLSSANAQDENTACRQMNFTRLFLALAGYVYCKLRCVRFDSTVNQTFRMSA